MTAVGEHALSSVEIWKGQGLFVFRNPDLRHSPSRTEEPTAAYISNSS
jgi:hypothetical protein